MRSDQHTCLCLSEGQTLRRIVHGAFRNTVLVRPCGTYFRPRNIANRELRFFENTIQLTDRQRRTNTFYRMHGSERCFATNINPCHSSRQRTVLGPACGKSFRRDFGTVATRRIGPEEVQRVWSASSSRIRICPSLGGVRRPCWLRGRNAQRDMRVPQLPNFSVASTSYRSSRTYV
jgi:hypothetical protein